MALRHLIWRLQFHPPYANYYPNAYTLGDYSDIVYGSNFYIRLRDFLLF